MGPHYSLLFWEGGVLKFGRKATKIDYTTLEGTDDPLSRIWVLVDSNQHLVHPSEPFSDCGPFFVVVAVSPCNRFHWSKKAISFSFFMKPWTFSEVLQV